MWLFRHPRGDHRRFLRPPNWLSDLAKNAPKNPNDKEAWNKYLVQAELDNLKDGAIAVATLGAGKALGPVICKITGRGCFAAGMPARRNRDCIAVEQVREGTDLLTVEEDDPDGALTTQPVAQDVPAVRGDLGNARRRASGAVDGGTPVLRPRSRLDADRRDSARQRITDGRAG